MKIIIHSNTKGESNMAWQTPKTDWIQQVIPASALKWHEYVELADNSSNWRHSGQFGILDTHGLFYCCVYKCVPKRASFANTIKRVGRRRRTGFVGIYRWVPCEVYGKCLIVPIPYAASQVALQ